MRDLQPAAVRQSVPGLGVRDLDPQAPTLDHEAEREPGEPGEPRRGAGRPVRVAETPEAADQRDPGVGRVAWKLAGRCRPSPTRKQAGMSLFQRAHDIVRAKANKALDAAERPDEMLDLSYEDMLDQITMVKQGLVSIAASRKHIELQEQQLQHTVEHLDDAARAALTQEKGDLAREALNRKAAAQQQIAGFDAQRDELNEQQQKMEQALSVLQDRVTKFRSQKEVLKAQYQAARAQTAVSETATGMSGSFGDTGTELQRSMDKIEAMQARAGAMDELLQSGVLEDVGGNTDDIEQELEEAGRNAQVDKELAAMRAEIASSPETPQLQQGPTNEYCRDP